MDDFTLDTIFRECGIEVEKDQGLTESQLFEVIELINHVGMALSQDLDATDEESGLDSDADIIETEASSVSSGLGLLSSAVVEGASAGED